MHTGLRHTYSQLGWLNASLYCLGRVLERVSGGRWQLYRYYFVAQQVDDADLAGARGGDIDIALMDAGSIGQIAYPRPAHVIRQRYAQGAFSLVARRQGQLAGFLWLILDAYQEDEVRARYRLLSSEAAWDFDVWVRPEDRMGWVFRRLWDEARRLLRRRAVRWSCSRISAFNPSSLRAHARIGTRRLGHALFLRCGGWQWMYASLPPRFHLSRHPASFPQLSFDTTTLTHQEPPCPT